MLKIVLFLVLFAKAIFAEFEYRVDNTNFTLSQGSVLYNYDRLRLRGDYTQENFFITIIGDGVNYLGSDYLDSNDFEYLRVQESDTPFRTQTNFHDYDKGSVYAKLYRLYGGYEDDKNRVIVGVQNITMGVGHIWTPTNLFNPKNSYALEPDETFGVMALSYTRHINDMSHVTVVASQIADNSFKYGGRYKAFLDFADFAIDILSSDDTKMLGFELEGNLYDSGVELRSEGAYIKNTEEFFQGIIGADYGFVNGVTLVVEALYSSKKFSNEERILNLNSEIASNLVNSNFYTALSLSYSFNIFLNGSLLYIENFDNESSRFISPSLSYTLDDYNSFAIGAMINDKSDDIYYFKYALSF